MADWDVVVVGAGSAGCPLAARLADAGRRVLLLEAGADAGPDLLDAGSLRAAVPGGPGTWDVTARLTGAVTVQVARGRVVGGSSAVNGAYFVRPTAEDVAGWGGGPWAPDAVLAAFCRLEDDADFGDRPGHGSGGPVPVRRSTPHPVSDAFGEAAAGLGFPAEPDKNAGAAPGWGPVPRNVASGVRVSTAAAYLSPRRGLPGLTVRGGVRVRRVLLERGRAVGVATDAGEVRAAEVVLSAGAVGSPHLLLLSGIGPAAVLRSAGLDVAVDLPGVGAGASDHPDVYLPWTPSRPLPAAEGPLHSALNTADVELQPWLRSFAAVGLGDSEDLQLRVALQRVEGRGRLVLGADPAALPRIEQDYLADEADRRRLRAGVRLAVDLLRAPAVAPLVAGRGGPPDDVLADDAALDRWLLHSVGTAVHLSGTARMGPDGDPGAVVDPLLRVRGVEGLRVVDTSVLPRVPTRGPAATAVLLGERAAELVLG